MADQSAVQPAQVIKLCELCNEDNVKWRCIDCQICLCQKCENFHKRLPGTAKHQIVTIETPIQDVRRKIHTDNIPCKDHMSNSTCMFCETCDCLVCPECVSTSHRKHQFIHIEKALESKLAQLEGTKANVLDNLKVCDSKNTEIQYFMARYNSIFDESVTKIKQKEQELTEAITKNSKLFQEKIEVERSKLNTCVTNLELEVNNSKKMLDDTREKLETALTSNQGQVIFDTSLTEPVSKFNDLPQKVQKFIPETDTTTNQIQELFGLLQDVAIPAIQSELAFEPICTFTTDLPSIQTVLPLNETEAWIDCGDSIKQVVVNIPEITMVISKEISLAICDMDLTSENDILLTEEGNSDLKLITKSGQTKSFLSVAPLLPLGIHVTSDNTVIVGVQEQGNVFELNEKSQRAIMLFGMNGRQKNRYQYDKNNKGLFTVPYRIQTNNNQDIFVIDTISTDTGRVVSLDRDGNSRWIYKGHNQINSTRSFDPRGITTTSNYIIVSDIQSHALHVLSENGDVLTCKAVGEIGVMYPWGLNINMEGKLWVSCGTGGGEFCAKLHIVKLPI